jgi:hypothetical protein
MKVFGRMVTLVPALFTMAAVVMGSAPAGHAATHAHANLTCTTEWDNRAGGSFETAADWSGGAVPGSSDVACITMAGSYAVDMTQSHTVAGLVLGGAGSGTQTLDLQGGAITLALNGTSTISAGGVLELDSINGGYSDISGSGTLTNSGTLTAVQDAGGTRYIEVNAVNTASGVVSIGADTRVDGGTDFTNDGALTVAASGGLSFTGGSVLEQDAGTITGTIALSGGNVADSGGTGGTLLAECGTSGLSGTIPAGQTVEIAGSPCGDAVLSLGGTTVTNKGTIKLESTTSSAYAQLSGNAVLENKAALTTVKGKGLCYLEVNLVSAKAGRITVGAATRVDAGTDFTNDGKIKVASSGGLTFSGGSTLEQDAGTVTGTIALSGGNVADSGGTGGTLLAECGTSGLSGTIPAGQTVQIAGGPCGNAVLSLSGTTVTNDGTITLSSTTTSQYADLSGNAFLDNNGTLTTVQGGGSTRYLEVNFVNETSGTVSIGSADTRVDAGTDFTNNGSVSVADGDGLAFSGGSVFSQGSAGTLGVTVDATTGNGYGISGNTISVAGKLAITTVGTPSSGSVYTVISATSLTGRFASIQSGTSYTPKYSSTRLTLTAK